MSGKIIAFELNEVPYSVIDAFVAAYPHSQLAKILPRSACVTAVNPDSMQLHPKVSWQTFHRGVPDTQHGFVEYNQTEAPGKGDYPPVWELLRSEGHRVGVGASIGAYPLPDKAENIAFYLTDPFAPDPASKPDYLRVFQQFNTAAVSHSSRNVRAGGMSRSNALQLLLNLPRLGIRLATCWHVVKQLLAERRNPAHVVRRRNIQALLSFDVCMTQIKRQKPQFCTVFANHVAAAMHRYWAARFPDDYEENRMPQSWRDTYNDEIDAAMRDTDQMLKQLVRFVERQPEYSLLVLSSMGQAAIEHEVVRNQLVIKDLGAFMNCLGFGANQYDILPGMEPEYVVRFSNATDCSRFDETLSRVSINAQQPGVHPVNELQIRFLVFQYNIDIDSIGLKDEAGSKTTISLKDAGMHIEPIQDMTGSTAQHVPEGCCFIYDGEKDLSALTQREQRVDLCAVSASILAALDTPVPEYMPQPDPVLVAALAQSELVAEHNEKPLTDTQHNDSAPVQPDKSADKSKGGIKSIHHQAPTHKIA